MYPVPYSWYTEYGVRKYGFHGTSHKYIMEYMKKKLGKDDVNLIICHIGNGASLSAVKNGKCYNTSMGLTPLDGLMMGTRCGNIDASVVEYMARMLNADVAFVTEALNKKSGLLGISGKSDQRDVQALVAEGDDKAILAMKMFAKSVINYIAQYYFQLEGKLDAIVFTAGVGENNITLRAEIINRISHCINVKLNEQANNVIAQFLDVNTGIISTADSEVAVWVVPTNEEYMILEDTIKLTAV